MRFKVVKRAYQIPLEGVNSSHPLTELFDYFKIVIYCISTDRFYHYHKEA